MKYKIAYLTVFFIVFQIPITFADPVIINNNMAAPEQPRAQTPQPPYPQQAVPGQAQGPCNANQNDIYDSRVPPAGAYYTKNPDGSGTQTFTTGEKKPYITDNGCGQSQQPIIQPYIQPPSPPIPPPR